MVTNLHCLCPCNLLPSRVRPVDRDHEIIFAGLRTTVRDDALTARQVTAATSDLIAASGFALLNHDTRADRIATSTGTNQPDAQRPAL